MKFGVIYIEKGFSVPRDYATQAFLVSFEAQRCDFLKGDAFEGEDDANIAI